MREVKEYFVNDGSKVRKIELDIATLEFIRDQVTNEQNEDILDETNRRDGLRYAGRILARLIDAASNSDIEL